MSNDAKKFIKLNVSKELPFFAKKIIANIGRFYESINLSDSLFKDIPPITINIVPLTKKLKKEHCKKYKTLNKSYKIFEGGFIEKSRYKFSSWESMIFDFSESMDSISIAVKGDFFSQWVWPCRTLSCILRLFLTYWGIIPVHAAGFDTGNGATLMLAPSGTGKTLTTLNWLCRGNKFFSDDQAYICNGKVLPFVGAISYWAHRYKGNSDAIPDSMPLLHNEELQSLKKARIISFLSFGYVSFGASLSIKKYWPNSIAKAKEVTKIILLEKSDKFEIIKSFSEDEAINRIMGDLRFQCLPILRWAETAKITNYNLFLAKWEENCRKRIEKLVRNKNFIKIGIPQVYTQKTYEQLEAVIK